MSAKEPRDGGGAGKEGSGRVGVYRSTGLPHTFTLECNYNTGRVVNRIAHPHSASDASLSPQPPLRCLSPKYTPETWHSVGKARRLHAATPCAQGCDPMCPRLQPHVHQAATPATPRASGCKPVRPRLQLYVFQALFLAALDLHGANPCSRLGAPGEMAAAGLARLRSTSAAWVRTVGPNPNPNPNSHPSPSPKPDPNPNPDPIQVRTAARAAKEKTAKRLAKKAAADGPGGRPGSGGGSGGSGGNGSDEEDDKVARTRTRTRTLILSRTQTRTRTRTRRTLWMRTLRV